MQCRHEVRVSSRRTVPLAVFMADDPALKSLAADCGMEPLDFIASEFVPEVEEGEQCRDWLVRQVQGVLVTRLMTDDWRELPDGRQHTAGRIRQVELDPADRQWIADVFADRPDVQEVWVEAHARAWAQAA